MKESFPDFSIEKQYWDVSMIVAGIDEAGRGALAGPVFAAAVILDSTFPAGTGINDSKKLTSTKREQLFDIITQKALSYCIAAINHEDIDRINVLQATMAAMKEAVCGLGLKPDQLLVDGNYFRGWGIPYKTITKGDSRSISIAAASILAKVSRDRWMTDQAARLYPEFCFEQHKGYGTRKHYECLEKYGQCDIHRKTFLKKFFLKPITLFD